MVEGWRKVDAGRGWLVGLRLRLRLLCSFDVVLLRAVGAFVRCVALRKPSRGSWYLSCGACARTSMVRCPATGRARRHESGHFSARLGKMFEGSVERGGGCKRCDSMSRMTGHASYVGCFVAAARRHEGC